MKNTMLRGPLIIGQDGSFAYNFLIEMELNI